MLESRVPTVHRSRPDSCGKQAYSTEQLGSEAAYEAKKEIDSVVDSAIDSVQGFVSVGTSTVAELHISASVTENV